MPWGTDPDQAIAADRKSTRLNSSHLGISYAVFCLKKLLELPRDPPERGRRADVRCRPGLRQLARAPEAVRPRAEAEYRRHTVRRRFGFFCKGQAARRHRPLPRKDVPPS